MTLGQFFCPVSFLKNARTETGESSQKGLPCHLAEEASYKHLGEDGASTEVVARDVV